MLQEAIEALRCEPGGANEAVVGRIVEIEGFSTRPGDDLVAIDGAGVLHGSLLAGLAEAPLKEAAARMRASGVASLERVTFDIGDKDAVSAGLACGGRAHVLLQPAAEIPGQLWQLLGSRAPAALITRVEGAGAGPAATVVDPDGATWGAAVGDDVLAEAVKMLTAGRTETRRVEAAGGVVSLVEAWVPEPRLVVVGAGELVAAINSQADLLGWSVRATPDAGLDELLDWAGVTAALIVLSHDPHVDSPALAEGLRRRIAYVGALGSRSTQARRTERLLAAGVEQSDIDGIHRPIGLDLGGRRAAEVALAIVAEVLASHCGRDARPLSQRAGPIHG